MPSTLLFAVNNEGRVFGLSTKGTKWREFNYLGLEFKQLSAVPHFLWAVGGDRQVYVHVHGLDIPIRVKEESFENERWTPFEGFSNKLLPTDRYNFSNQDGTIDRSLKKIRLPSMAWQWEGDWKLELNLDGQPLDHDGWTYAVDFPATYYPTKQWASCVRRRKWVRYRKYIALNSWCAIAPLHKDPTKEPFIAVAVGGKYLPGGKDGTMLVWAVTAYGRIMFRTDVSTMCPEGQRWSSVPVPAGCEVSQVSIGATGLVWVVLWNGKALVRTGVTRESLTGNGWAEIDSPPECLSLNQVSVGCNGVWATTKDSKVWFRKGIKGECSGISTSLAVGTGWVEMCGSMTNVSVSSNDQVWALGANDKILYFRTSVTQEDLMGKTWRALGAPTQCCLENDSFSSATSSTGKRHRSWSSLNQGRSTHHSYVGDDFDFNKTCHSAPAVARNILGGSTGSSPEKFSSTLPSLTSSGSVTPSEPENRLDKSHVQRIVPDFSKVKEFTEFSSVEAEDTIYQSGSHPVCASSNREISVPTRSWSPQYAGGSVVGTEAHNAADSIVFEADESAGIYSEHGEREDEDDHLYWTDSEAYWSTVEAGACLVDVNCLPKWFTDCNENTKKDLVKPWRMKILNELKGRLPKDIQGLENYVKAVDSSSWVKTGICKCVLPNERNFRDCLVELEWFSSEDASMDCGTLIVSSPAKEEDWIKIDLESVIAVIDCSAPKSHRLAVYKNCRTSVKLAFETEDEYEEWKCELSSVCCKLRNISGVPSTNSVWLTTSMGDIFVCDLNNIASKQHVDKSNNYYLEYDFTQSSLPVEIPLYSSFLPGSSLMIRGCVCDHARRFYVDFLCREENGNTDIAYHFNPRFDEGIVVENRRHNLVWGTESRSRVMPFKVGSLFEVKFIFESDCFISLVDGLKFTEFNILRDSGSEKLFLPYVTHLRCGGDFQISKIEYYSKDIILDPNSMFLRQIPGHLKKVETAGGVTWGIGFDNTAWLYLADNPSDTRKMHDTRYYYLYENQRWNPLTGYTALGLPTDRFMWSDITGKHKKTRETTVLPSKKWRWINDWSIDFHTPGGVDKEGWQYAMDFPSSYHGTKNLIDYVRRRRWFRCAQLEASGPWSELGYTPLSDCSLYSSEKHIVAWAVAADGCVMVRKGVTRQSPAGLSWEYVTCDEQIQSISCGRNQVWAIGKSGAAYCRLGITPSNPLGDFWETVKAPTGCSLKQIAIGNNGIWALDACGRVLTRIEVSTAFPFGSHWRAMPALPQENQNDDFGLVGKFDKPEMDLPLGFRQISANNELWAVTTTGNIAFRLGISQSLSMGCIWMFGIKANFFHVSA